MKRGFLGRLMDRYLILCAGEMRRWRNHLGVAKQLIEIDGVPLVDRTVALLRKHGAEDVVIVSASDAMGRPDSTLAIVKPDVTGTVADKFLSSRHLWSEDGATHVLFGDVWFSEHAIAQIVVAPANTRFLGRLQGSNFTGCTHAEIFALSIPAREAATIDAALQEIRVLGPERPGVASGWSLYANLLERQNRKDGSRVSFLHVDDFTEDFDSPIDFHTWLAARKAPRMPFQQRARRRKKTRRALRRYGSFGALMLVGSLLTLAVQRLLYA